MWLSRALHSEELQGKNIQKAFDLAYLLHPEKTMAWTVMRDGYDRIHSIRQLEAKSRASPRAFKIPTPEAALPQVGIFHASDSWERKQEIGIDKTEPFYEPTADDKVVRYIKCIVMNTMHRDSGNVAVGLGALLYTYSSSDLCNLAPDIFDEDNIRRDKKRIAQCLKDRFSNEENTVRLKSANKSDQLLTREILKALAPWVQPHYSPAAQANNLLDTYFHAGSKPLDWNRNHILIDPDCGGLPCLIQEFNAQISQGGEDMKLDDPEAKLSLPVFHGDRDDHNNRLSPPTLLPQDTYIFRESIKENRRRRKSFVSGRIRVHVDGQERSSFWANDGESVPFSVSLPASQLEVFGEDAAGDFLLAFFPFHSLDLMEIEQPAEFKIEAEGKQKIRCRISPELNKAGEVVSGLIQIRYEPPRGFTLDAQSAFLYILSRAGMGRRLSPSRVPVKSSTSDEEYFLVPKINYGINLSWSVRTALLVAGLAMVIIYIWGRYHSTPNKPLSNKDIQARVTPDSPPPPLPNSVTNSVSPSPSINNAPLNAHDEIKPESVKGESTNHEFKEQKQVSPPTLPSIPSTNKTPIDTVISPDSIRNLLPFKPGFQSVKKDDVRPPDPPRTADLPRNPGRRKQLAAVLDFNFNAVDIGLARKAFGNVQNLAQQISVKLSSRLTNLGTCHVIEPQQLIQILQEQRLGVAGVLDPNTMARVGKVLGVDSVVLGNVTVFDIQGLPTRGERQSQWDPSEMSVRLQVSFRVVDTTTAFIEMSQEATGSYTLQRERKSSTSKSIILADILGGLGNRNTRSSEPQARATDEQVKAVVEGAVDDVVTKISASLESHFSNARERAAELKTPANQINGTVVEINQNRTVYIADIDKSLVRRGDRLYVRRGRKKVNPQTGKEYKFTEKIGEVEIMEIQDELVVGSFSGSLEVMEGDIVTSNESGVGLSPMIRSTQPAKEQPVNPTPNRTKNPAGTTPIPAYTPPSSSSPSGPRPIRPRP